MKVLYLTHDINKRGGWGRYSSDIIDSMKSKGFEATVLVEERVNDSDLLFLKRGLGIFSSVCKVRKFAKNCDIIHALDGYPYGIIAVLASLGLKKRVIINAVGTYAVAPLFSRKIGFVMKWAYKKADLVIAISRYTKQRVEEVITAKKIIVINPGVDFSKFFKPRIDNTENFILSIGGIKGRKGYPTAITAFAQVKKHLPELKYIIVGNQKNLADFDHLRKIASENKVKDSIIFLNNVSDQELSDLYAKARLFLLPSINVGFNFEGFGLVFLEAASAGLPIVATKNNGISDAVKNEYNGILVEQNNVNQTADAINSLLMDQNKWNQFSRNGYNWAKQNDLPVMIEKYLSVYLGILK